MDVLLVSKPVGPPWNDSSKNLVRDLAGAMTRHRPTVLGRKGGEFELPRGRVESLYPAGSGRFTPTAWDQARVVARLLAGRRADVWHFFSAPNTRAARAGRMMVSARRPRTVHTICSVPHENADASVFFCDKNVVLSRRTGQRLAAMGLDPSRIHRIAPCVAEHPAPDPERRAAVRKRLGLPTDAFVVTFPGDLEFGRGGVVTAEAMARLGDESVLALACRAKTPRARSAATEVQELVNRLGTSPRTHWFGETPSILALLSVSDVVVLPTDTLYAKMDYPLVLLEAMGMGRPVVVAEGTSADELGEHGAMVVEPSADGLSAALLALRDDEVRRRELGETGARAVADVFSPRAMARAYEALYDQLA